MKYFNSKLGAIGEEYASKFLLDNGYKIVTRNFKCKVGEIDIVAFDKTDKCYVFVEVKFRTTLKYGYPKEAIDYRKQNKIKKTATYYLCSKKLYEKVDVRFDCVELVYEDVCKTQIINHLKNIF